MIYVHDLHIYMYLICLDLGNSEGLRLAPRQSGRLGQGQLK